MKTGYMGVSPAAYETEKLRNYVKEFPYAAVARDQLEFATAELSTFQTGRVRKALDDAIQATLTGSKSAADALGDAQAEAVRLLKPYQELRGPTAADCLPLLVALYLDRKYSDASCNATCLWVAAADASGRTSDCVHSFSDACYRF